MSTATLVSNITIRDIDELKQMRAVEELQKEIWGIPDLDVAPLTHLVATREAGGVLIGAFDEDQLAGFIYGFPSIERGQLAHHSHMLAVKQSYRDLDLGRQLKLAQRERVIGQGIELMSWTFDPLQSLNAYFNFNKLGVVSDRYLVDFYGKDASSFLHQTGTDRLWVSWFLSSERVKRRVSGVNNIEHINVEVPLVQVEVDGEPRRNEASSSLIRNAAAIEIPGNINQLQLESPAKALKWREETRWAFTEALKAGYLVAGFARAKRGESQIGKYLLCKGKLSTLLNDFA